MLFLFVPWTDECDLKMGKESYKDALLEANTKQLIIDDIYNIFELKRKKIVTAVEKIKELQTERPEVDGKYKDGEGQEHFNIDDLGVAE